MYFGMTNSLATFQALMNSVFADLIAKGEIAVYMDDILIYTEDLKHHRKIVREVLAWLLKYDLYLKPKKCNFEKQEMEYLGMILCKRIVNDFRWLTKKSDKVKAKLGKVNGQVSDSHCKVRAEYLATSLTMSDLGKSENGLLKVNKDLEQKQCIEKGCMG